MVNQLYPAFFRLDRLQMLVVGAGEVGEEKLKFILKSSPNARVTIVAPWMGEELRSLLEGYQHRTYQAEMARTQAERPVPNGVLSKDQKAMQDQMLRDDGSGQFDVAKLAKLGSFQLHDTQYTIGQEGDFAGLYFTPEGGAVVYLQREFLPEDIESADLVVAATNFPEVNRAVYDAAKANRRLCNIADTPSLCDFYLGSIVTRGPL
ncbi:MAG: NAD(P)-dependent oxidoreductase, partial [Bacteroidota bacterium]